MRLRPILLIGAAVAGAAVLVRKAGIHEDLDWGDVDKPGQLIDVDGYKVHYLDRGVGPAIVLLHGFGGHTYSYRHLVPTLALDHRVIAVDLKGYGYSERNAYVGLSQTAQVAMLKGLLDRLGVAHATFVGHSMGGGVVQRFAVAHPDMVDALVLAASVSGEARAGRRVLPPGRLLNLAVPLLAKFAASRMLQGSFYDPATLTDEVRDEYMRPIRIKGSMDGLIAIMRDGAADTSVDIAKITQPVLLLYGEHDKLVRPTVGREIQKRIPHARMVVVERAGHLLLEEQAQACASAIGDFLHEAGMASAARVADG